MWAPAGVLRTAMEHVMSCAAACRGSAASSGCASSTTALLRLSIMSVCVCAPAAEVMGTMMMSISTLRAAQSQRARMRGGGCALSPLPMRRILVLQASVLAWAC